MPSFRSIFCPIKIKRTRSEYLCKRPTWYPKASKRATWKWYATFSLTPLPLRSVVYSTVQIFRLDHSRWRHFIRTPYRYRASVCFSEDIWREGDSWKSRKYSERSWNVFNFVLYGMVFVAWALRSIGGLQGYSRLGTSTLESRSIAAGEGITVDTIHHYSNRNSRINVWVLSKCKFLSKAFLID